MNLFDCCSQWPHCSYVGYCVRGLSFGEDAWEGDKQISQCTLCKNLFVRPKEGFKETWYASAQRYYETTHTVPPAVNDALRKRFELAVEEYKSRPKQTTATVPAKWTSFTAGITLRGDVFWMPKTKVIESKPGMELVSWLYKDIVHYGIQDSEGGMLEVFKPTSARKGNQLRAYAIEEFRKREVSEYMGKWPTVANCAEDVQVGHVVAYESRPGSVVFALIRKITPSLIFAVTNSGSDAYFFPKKLTDKIQREDVYVIDRASVPEKLNTFPVEG